MLFNYGVFRKYRIDKEEIRGLGSIFWNSLGEKKANDKIQSKITICPS